MSSGSRRSWADVFLILGFYTCLPPLEAFPKAARAAETALLWLSMACIQERRLDEAVAFGGRSRAKAASTAFFACR